VECLEASVILLVMLSLGACVIVLIDDRRIDVPALLGVTLILATLIWLYLAPATSSASAEILGLSAAGGGITATLIIGAGFSERESGAVLPGPWLIKRLVGTMLVLVSLAGALFARPAPVAGAALLLGTGIAVCIMAGDLRRAAIGLVLVLFGMHLLYLALLSGVNVLETLLLDSLPGGVTLVLAALGTVHTAPRPASRIWTAILPDGEEPLS
jgi:hypothetical protein